MDTQTKKFIFSFPKSERVAFFELARKHIVKKKKGVSKRLSRDINKILYGA